MSTKPSRSTGKLCPPSQTLIIRETREIQQATSYSDSLPSQMNSITSATGTVHQQQLGWEKEKMILCFHSPPSFPCSTALRSFQGAVRVLLKSNQSDAPKQMSLISPTKPTVAEGALFDEMLNGETRSPIQLAEFAAYLNAEGTAHNLNFLLWYKGYARRFAQLAPEEMILHPLWTDKDQERAVQSLLLHKSTHASNKSSPSTASNVDCHKDLSYHNKADSPYDSTRSSIANSDNGKDEVDDFQITQQLHPPSRSKSRRTSSFVPVQMAEKPLDIKVVAPWDESPVTTPLKSSCTALLATNQHIPISIETLRADVKYTLRKYGTLTYPECLDALDISPESTYLIEYATARSLHPTSLFLAIQHVEHILQHESYPRFLLSVVTNANPARVNCALLAGVLVVLLGLAGSIAVMEVGWERSFRIPGAVVTGLGASVIYAAWMGMCLILLAQGKGQYRPWDSSDFQSAYSLRSSSDTRPSKEKDLERCAQKSAYNRNRYGWLELYQRRWIISRVFEREKRVEANFLREGQRIVFWQALWAGFLVAAGLCIVSLPIRV